MSSEYPEHMKMRMVRVQSQTIGEFLDWMRNERCWDICRLDRHDGEYHPTYKSIEVLLAEYFHINLQTIEEEKQQMFSVLRASYEPQPTEPNFEAAYRDTQPGAPGETE